MNVQEWDDEQSREFATKAGIPAGHIALVRDEQGNMSFVRGVEGGTAGQGEDCPATECAAVFEALKYTCQKFDWPPGYKVLVCDGTGSCCYCACP